MYKLWFSRLKIFGSFPKAPLLGAYIRVLFTKWSDTPKTAILLGAKKTTFILKFQKAEQII